MPLLLYLLFVVQLMCVWSSKEELSSVLAYFDSIDLTPMNPDQQAFVERARRGDPSPVYHAARDIGWRDSLLGKQDAKLAVNLLTYNSAVHEHAPSQALLGRMYAKGEPPLSRSPAQGLYWLQQAGAQGDQAALYNAGLILSEGTSETDAALIQEGKLDAGDFVNVDIVGGLAYFHAAATLHNKYPEAASTDMTDMSRKAHSVVATTAAYAELTIRQVLHYT